MARTRSSPTGPQLDRRAQNLTTRPCLYKTELIKPRDPWRTVDHVELATAEWVDWFNHRCLYRSRGDIPPAELEAAYYSQQPAQQPAGLSYR